MIDPPRRGQPYPGRLPPVFVQWRRLGGGLRAGLVVLPLIAIGGLLAVNIAVGVTAAVLLGGAAAATATYAKNRTDRHNAAVDRGEIRLVDDPHLDRRDPTDVPPDVAARVVAAGIVAAEVGSVARFDGGWLIHRRRRGELGVVLGDDGGQAFFHPRTGTDRWAVSEYRAGRGREPV